MYKTNYEAITRCIPHVKIVHLLIHQICQIMNNTRQVIKRNVLLLQPSDLFPSRIYSFRARIEVSPPPPPPPDPSCSKAPPKIKFCQSSKHQLVNTTSQLISTHYLSSHPCRSSNSSPPPFFPCSLLFKRRTYNRNQPDNKHFYAFDSHYLSSHP